MPNRQRSGQSHDARERRVNSRPCTMSPDDGLYEFPNLPPIPPIQETRNLKQPAHKPTALARVGRQGAPNAIQSTPPGLACGGASPWTHTCGVAGSCAAHSLDAYARTDYIFSNQKLEKTLFLASSEKEHLVTCRSPIKRLHLQNRARFLVVHCLGCACYLRCRPIARLVKGRSDPLLLVSFRLQLSNLKV
jgi:hypothetical protein